MIGLTIPTAFLLFGPMGAIVLLCLISVIKEKGGAGR